MSVPGGQRLGCLSSTGWTWVGNPSRLLQATHLGISTDQRSDKDSEAWVPDSEERLILREEFTSRMHQRFLDGKDGGFDYSTVDDNPDFDNLDIVARDEEDRYFDEEEPEDVSSAELDGD